MKCKSEPEPALYNGGILKYGDSGDVAAFTYQTSETGVFSTAFVVYGLNQSTKYTFSCKSMKIIFFLFSKKKNKFFIILTFRKVQLFLAPPSLHEKLTN
jgi:hypothetical protein